MTIKRWPWVRRLVRRKCGVASLRLPSGRTARHYGSGRCCPEIAGSLPEAALRPKKKEAFRPPLFLVGTSPPLDGAAGDGVVGFEVGPAVGGHPLGPVAIVPEL